MGRTLKDSQIRILLIIDDQKISDILQTEIKKSYKKSICKGLNSNSEVIEQLDQFHPDIIIYYLLNENPTCKIVFDKINSIAFQIPIIILSTYNKEDEAIKCVEEGAADYILVEQLKRINPAILNAVRIKNDRIELKHSEHDLNEYEKYINKYRQWEKNIPGMVYQFVLRPDGNYSFTYVSSAARNLFGVEPEVVVQDINNLLDIVHPDDYEKLTKAIFDSAATLKTFKQDSRFLINNELKWYRFISQPKLQANGEIIWDGFLMDNTENKHLEDELVEERKQIQLLLGELKKYSGNDENINDKPNSKTKEKNNVHYSYPFITKALTDQSRFNILMDNMPESIYFTDTEGRFIKVNKHFVNKVGETSDYSVVGKTAFDFFDPAHASESRNDELNIIKTGKPIINKIEKEIWPSGKITWVSTTKVLFNDSNKKILGTFGISRDITKSKLMEEALAQEHNLMRELIDAIPERIYVRDNKGKFILNNTTDLQFYGIKSQEEIRGKDDFDFYDKNYASEFLEEDKAIIRTRMPVLNKESKLRNSLDEYKWFVSTKVPLSNIHGETSGMVGICHEITNRKKMESALIASEEKLSNTLKIAKIAYWDFDVVQDKFTFNDQFYALLRTTAEKEGGYQMSAIQYAQRFVHPDDAYIVGKEVQKSIETTDPNYSNQLEHRIIYADGEVGYFSVKFYVIKNDKGITVKTFGANQDITKRKKAEDALASSEYFLRKSQKIAQLGSYSLDLNTSIWESSEILNEIFGFKNNAPKDLDEWVNLIHPEDRENVVEDFNKKVFIEHQRFEKQYRIIRLSDNQERWILSTGDLEFDNNDNPVRLIGTTQDITERVLREREKHELEKQLIIRNKELEKTLQNLKQMQGTVVQSEKMASIGQLTAGIAHEINNPLAFVSSNINRLKEYFEDTILLLNKWIELGHKIKTENKWIQDLSTIEEFSEEIDLNFILEDFDSMLKSINEGTQRIKKIVEGLRGFAHISDASFAAASINQAIDDTLTIVWNELKYKAEIKKEFDDLPEIICNIGEIKQVLVNLLVNAAHSIKEKGLISISTKTAGEWVFINIRDTGSGISNENLKRIFDPFFTTKKIGKGTGLGLWVSSSIIEKHGGLLSVNSEVGVGSTFTIKLPIKQKQLEKV